MFTKVSFKVHNRVDNSKISNEGLFCNCNHRFKIKTNNENILQSNEYNSLSMQRLVTYPRWAVPPSTSTEVCFWIVGRESESRPVPLPANRSLCYIDSSRGVAPSWKGRVSFTGLLTSASFITTRKYFNAVFF